jgi:hypothetical protein
VGCVPGDAEVVEDCPPLRVSRLRTDGNDDAGGLVAQHHGHRTGTVPVYDRQVGMADARRLHFDQDLLRSGLGEIEFPDSHRPRLGTGTDETDGLKNRTGDLHVDSFKGLCFISLICFYESVIRTECTLNICLGWSGS